MYIVGSAIYPVGATVSFNVYVPLVRPVNSANPFAAVTCVVVVLFFVRVKVAGFSVITVPDSFSF